MDEGKISRETLGQMIREGSIEARNLNETVTDWERERFFEWG